MTSLLPNSTHTFNSTAPVCRCGCARTSHEHYRRGTDCALCSCPRYRDARRPNLVEQLLRSLRVRPA
jgi:hypothetical protein